MKIFSPPESNAPVEGSKVNKSKKNSKGAKSSPISSKQDISEREIREKLASHTELSNTAKSQVIQKNSQALGAGFMNEDIKPVFIDKPKATESETSEVEAKSDSLKESHLLLSDVKLNDPKDSNTQEKLKSVLKMGAFNFNPKEKEALEKILAVN